MCVRVVAERIVWLEGLHGGVNCIVRLDHERLREVIAARRAFCLDVGEWFGVVAFAAKPLGLVVVDLPEEG